ncbi:MAG: antiterminator Q family protein [Candidatus Arsenophonus phytopathogenicus]
MSRHVKDLLKAWGNWSMSRIGTEYKGMSTIAPVKFDDDRPWLSDEEGEIVDKAVAGLKKYDIDGYNIICLHYQHHISCRMIAKNWKKRPDYITAYMGRAESYIAGTVHTLLKATK